MQKRRITDSVFSVLIAAFTLFSSVTSAHAENSVSKVELTDAWHRYFLSIRTLSFEFQYVYLAHPVKSLVNTHYNYKFVLNGNEFRAETAFTRADSDPIYRTNAFDGRYFQSMDVTRSGQTSLTLARELRNDQPYGFTLPLLDMFSFAFRQGDVHSIEFLQSEAPWQWVARHIQKVEAGSRNGVTGLYLSIKGDRKYETYKVFVQGAGYFPSYYQHSAKVDLNGQPADEVSNIECVQTETWNNDGKAYLFPLQTQGALLRKGKVFVASYDKVTSSVKINQHVTNKGIFTLTRGQAMEIFDQDRFAKQREKAKEGSDQK